jgi:hypothetical protein
MVQQGTPPIPLPEPHAAVVSHVDGTKTLRACVEAAGIVGEDRLITVSRDLMRLLWRCGFGVLRW